jgi:protein O-GlcNAc transferase
VLRQGAFVRQWQGRCVARPRQCILDLSRYDEALAAFDAALASRAGYAEASLGRGNSLLRLKRFDEALAAYDKAAELGEAWVGRGNVFYELRRLQEAAAAYDHALALKPRLAEAWGGRGNVLREFKQYDEALIAYDKALLLRPDLTGVESAHINVKNCICDWAGWDTDSARLIASVRSGSLNAGPVEFLAIPSSAADWLDCAKAWIKTMYPPSHRRLWQGEQYAHDRIRVAYLSSDFREHPVSQLTAGMFEHQV